MRPASARRPTTLSALIACTAASFAIGAGCSSPPPLPDDEFGYIAALEGAEAALAVGEFDDALAGFEGVTRLAPAEPRAWEGVALSQVARGEDGAALDAFGELDALSGAPLRPELVRVRCGAARRRVEAALAVSRMQVALSRLAAPGVAACPEAQRLSLSVRVHFGAALRASDAADADRHYRRVLELEPGHERASLGLAASLMSNGNTAEALRTLSAALEEHPRSRKLVEAMVEALTVR